MDIQTQGILGAVLAQSNAEKEEKRRATWAGLFSGMLEDVDAIIQFASDPLLSNEYRRHFTPSVFLSRLVPR